MSSHTQLVNGFLRAAGRGDMEQVRRILEHKLEVDAASSTGHTALMSAARGCRVKVVRLLLNAGADPTRTARKGNTALHLAVEETPSEPGRQAECVRLLLQNGADPNAENLLGVTPLMNASWFGCARSAEILLKAGADTSRKDSLGATAESMARQRGHDEVLRVLAPAQ